MERFNGNECYFTYPYARQCTVIVGVAIAQYVIEVETLALTTQPERLKEYDVLLRYYGNQRYDT